MCYALDALNAYGKSETRADEQLEVRLKQLEVRLKQLEVRLKLLAADAATERVLEDIGHERKRQDEKWGAQRHHPDGTHSSFSPLADRFREETEKAARAGELSWRDILLEEVYEALAETDPVKLRAELVQVAAVAAVWIEDIDSRA